MHRLLIISRQMTVPNNNSGGLMNITIARIFLVALLSECAHAAPISYNEELDGEIGSYSNPSDFVFDVGINTIAGTGLHNVFDFHVPVGMELQAVYFGYEIQGAGLIHFSQNLKEYPSGTILKYNDIPISAHNVIELFTDFTPLSAGDYGISSGALTSSQGYPYTIAFQFFFNVGMIGDDALSAPSAATWTLPFTSPELSEIPVPPAIWLLGSGILGLIGVAKRKKA